MAVSIDDVTAAARRLAESGDVAGATELLRRLAETARDNKLAVTEAAQVLLEIGRSEDALDLLRDAHARVPDSALFMAGLVNTFLALGRVAEALPTLEDMARLTPDKRGAWINLGRAAMAVGHNDRARLAFDAALKLNPDDSDALIGVAEAARALGDLAQAEAAVRAAIAHSSGNINAYLELATVLMQLGRLAEALTAADVVAALAPGAIDGHRARGAVLIESGQPDLARDAFERAVAIVPDDVESLMGLAAAHARTGALPQATALAERVLTIDPTHAMAQHFAAAWGGTTPAAAPHAYVRHVFDSGAAHFDDLLEGALGYRTPQDAAALLHRLMPERARFRRLLDLGCGTGLVAAALAPLFEIPERVGVDLSPKMLTVAANKGLYTRLLQEDAVAALEIAEGRFDLISAIEVFIYVGRLEPFMAAAARRLAPGGVLIYSIERGTEDVKLMPSGRFTHDLGALEQLAAQYGLRSIAAEEIAIRTEAGQPVRGTLGVLTG